MSSSRISKWWSLKRSSNSCLSGVKAWLARTVAELAVMLFGPRLAAFLSFSSIDWGEMQKPDSVICLFRESFIKDIALLRTNTNFNYPVITAGFTRFQRTWLPKQAQMQTFYQKHLRSDSPEFQKAVTYARCLINLIQKQCDIRCLLSGNFDYWQDAAFKQVCNEKKIPFLVLCREHPVTKKTKRECIDWYKKAEYKFTGTAIAVAGQATTDVIFQSGVVSDMQRVSTTGLPRYDPYKTKQLHPDNIQPCYITLLTFTDGYYADETFREVLALFAREAQNSINNKLQFMIKTKDSEDTNAITRLLGKGFRAPVQIRDDLDMKPLLTSSAAVVGYNSLSLLEAALVGTPIIAPAWGQCRSDGEDVMLPASNASVQECVSFAHSPEEMRRLIRMACQIRLYRTRLGHILFNDIMFADPDRTSAELVGQFIKKHTDGN
jgi:hypothetical protein